MNPVVGLTYVFDPTDGLWKAVGRPDVPPTDPNPGAGYGSSPYGTRPYGE